MASKRTAGGGLSENSDAVKSGPAADAKNPPTLDVKLPAGVSEEQLYATLMTSPFPRHASMQMVQGENVMNVVGGKPSLAATIDALTQQSDRLEGGDVRTLIEMLSAQATTLDATADKLMRRAEGNRSNLEVFERYMRLALKAQASSRSTIEALAKLLRRGEQVVRHVHVYEGGQAVIAGTLNHGLAPPQGEGKDRKTEGQSDAAAAT